MSLLDEMPLDRTSVSAQTACDHCGQPVGNYPIFSETAVFCCAGCEIVYDALHVSGLEATYYKLREAEGVNDKPIVAISEKELDLIGLDSSQYVEKHTILRPDGNREALLFLEGLHCTACVWLIEQMPKLLAGVQEARVDYVRNQLRLVWDNQRVQLSQVAKWLAPFGYKLQPARQSNLKERSQDEQRLLIRLGIAWALAGNVMLLALAFYSGLDMSNQTELTIAGRWMSLVLATLSLGIGGIVFFQKALQSLRMAWKIRSLNRLHMDVPISFGILIGYFYSFWATITHKGDVWFDSITVLTAALLTARWLHLKSTRLAMDASDQLLTLVPTMARKISGKWNGDMNQPFELVSSELLNPGEVVVVYAGEVFPVDGILAAGETKVNNSVITGESVPVSCAVGDRVQAGATNMTGVVHVAVQAAGDQTRIGKLVAWVREGAEKPAEAVLWVDRFGGWFVLIVLILAVLTGILWWDTGSEQAMSHVVALLVVTCPCALGMATPLALAIGSGRAARAGIYLKQTSVFDTLNVADTIVLDKTGTLTAGRMKLIDWKGDLKAMQQAAVLESQSIHPIAQAFLGAFPETEALKRQLRHTIKGIETHAFGIKGEIEQSHVMIGRPDWVLQDVVHADPLLLEILENYAHTGDTPLAVACDHRLVAVARVGDEVRKEAFEMIQHWHQQQKEVYILSGDHPEVVAQLGRTLIISEDHLLGHQTPEMKQLFVENLKALGRKVLMLGDGVNDAAALRAADVGIAVQGSSTASMVSADVFVTSAGLAPIQNMLTSSRKVTYVVKRNLAFSLLYNLIMAMAAIVGWVNPLVAAVAMPLSSLVVIGSSILQQTFVKNSNL
ncbi:MAG: heavy metal translocating P-type ATPase [Bacteroidetes Order II. Incertae sedis bacterium]|nr:heavy metal translocating P-type ATPase [Bacteroidetes Order II. bacterium]